MAIRIFSARIDHFLGRLAQCPASSRIPPFPRTSRCAQLPTSTALLFALVPSYTIDSGLMTNAIASAKSSLEQRTNRILAPKRIQRRLDGNGKDRMVLPEFPILALNEVDVYYTYPLGLTRKAHEWDFIISRNTGASASRPTRTPSRCSRSRSRSTRAPRTSWSTTPSASPSSSGAIS